MLDKQEYTHAHTRIRPRTRAHTHAYTHAYTHTDKYVILIAFPVQQLLRERASILRYTYQQCGALYGLECSLYILEEFLCWNFAGGTKKNHGKN